MKNRKITSLLSIALVLISSLMSAQGPSSRAVLDGWWNGRVVPVTNYRQATWASFYNVVDNPATGTGSLVLTGTPTISYPIINTGTQSIGQVLVATNTLGACSWSTISIGGSPGGSNSQIQFNSAGTFTGSSGLTFTNNILTAPSLSAGITSTIGSASNKIIFSEITGAPLGPVPAIWLNPATSTGTNNYSIAGDYNDLILNSQASSQFRIANTTKLHISSSGVGVGCNASSASLQVAGTVSVSLTSTLNNLVVTGSLSVGNSTAAVMADRVLDIHTNTGNARGQVYAESTSGVAEFYAQGSNSQYYAGIGNIGSAITSTATFYTNGAAYVDLTSPVSFIVNPISNSNLVIAVGSNSLSAERMRFNNAGAKFTGTLQISDGSQGSGKVWTSDANGIGTWSTVSGGGGGGTSLPLKQIGFGDGVGIASSSKLVRDTLSGQILLGKQDGSTGFSSFNLDSKSMLCIARITDLADGLNAHGFVDATIFRKSAGVSKAYNSYRSNVVFDDGNAHDHYSYNEINAALTNSTTLNTVYGMYHGLSIDAGSSAGRYGDYFVDFSGTGSSAYQSALYVGPLTKATNNWAIDIVSNDIRTGGHTRYVTSGSSTGALTPGNKFYHANTVLTASIFDRLDANTSSLIFNVVDAGYAPKTIFTLKGDEPGETQYGQLDGSLKLSTAGAKINIKEGSNQSVGTATLSGGTITISNTNITDKSHIIVTGRGNSNIGELYTTRSNGASFTITSSQPLDARVVDYIIIEGY